LSAVAIFAPAIIEWQAAHGRHTLPWQNTQEPYRVWLSEIMLQQTQVATVLAYYAKFLQQFPTLQALAGASQDDVLSLWSGLGYYSRARHLHACAQAVVALHGGHFPQSSATLQTLPGIGRSTAAAIAAFCFGERVAILDGNVKRVLGRYLAYGEDLSVVANERVLWQWANQLLPPKMQSASEQYSAIKGYTQGLMDLGATVCTRRMPRCAHCPVQSHCAAHGLGQVEKFPVKTRKLKRSQRSHVWLLLCWGARIWLIQRPSKGVWARLWSLPQFDDLNAFEAAYPDRPGQGQLLPSIKHVLTHFDWTLVPYLWTLPDSIQAAQAHAITASLATGQWVSFEQALAMGVPAPLRKLLLQLQCEAFK
jgi:A/G-specific adenine glycosylase